MPDPRSPLFTEDPRWGSIYGRSDATIPRGPSNPVEGALQSILPLLTEFLRQRTGGYGFQFGSDMNVAQSQFAREYQYNVMRARTEGAADDARQVNDLFRGMAVMMGHKQTGRDWATGRVKFGDDVEAAIGRLSQDASGMLPILAAMFPDTIDRSLPRGSMAVAAANFVNAGRFVTDPLTGDQSFRTDPGLGRRVLSPLLAQDPIATAGLGAGRLGGLYEELVRYGLVDRGRGLRDQVAAREAAAGLFGEGGGGVGLTGERAREVQADRARDRLQEYSQTVAAINDIFAESGRANAPMAELIHGLQVLTQGGLVHYDPAALADVTRRLHAASQLSGVDLAGLSNLGMAGGALLRQYGGHRALAPQLTLRGVAAGDAFAERGYGTPSFEGMSRDEFLARAMRDQAAGAGSPAGNLIGALIRQGEMAGDDTDLRKVADALKTGRTSADLGGGRRFDLQAATQADYAGLFERSGLNRSAFLNQLQAPGANQAALAANPQTLAAIRSAQRGELDRGFLAMWGGGLRLNGMDPEAVLRELYAASEDSGLTTTDQIANRVGDRLKLNASQRSELLGIIGREGDRFAPGDPGGGMARLRLFNDATARDQDRRLGQFGERGGFLARLTHLQRGGWVRNISTAFQRAGLTGAASWTDLALRAAGFVGQDEVDALRRSPLDDQPLPLGDFGRPGWGDLGADPELVRARMQGAPALAGARRGGDLETGVEKFMGRGGLTRGLLAAALFGPGGPRGGAAARDENAPAGRADLAGMWWRDQAANLGGGFAEGAGREGRKQRILIELGVAHLTVRQDGSAQLSAEGTAAFGGGPALAGGPK